MARSRSCHLQCVEKWQDPDLATYYGLKNGKIRILPLTKSLKTPDPMGSGKIRISPSDFNRYVEYGIMKGGKIQVILFCFFKVARSRSCHFFCLKVARSMARIIFKLSYPECVDIKSNFRRQNCGEKWDRRVISSLCMYRCRFSN